jgi:excisionase family DNA binding protein
VNPLRCFTALTYHLDKGAGHAPQQKVDMRTSTHPRLSADDPVLTICGACDYLKLGRSTVYKLLQTGAIQYFRQGSRRYVRRSALEAYLDKLPEVGRG